MSTTIAALTPVERAMLAWFLRWVDTEEFPVVTHTVTSIVRIGQELTHWVVSVGGIEHEFDVPYGDQIPDAQAASVDVDDGLDPDDAHTRVRPCQEAIAAEITTDDI